MEAKGLGQDYESRLAMNSWVINQYVVQVIFKN